MRFLKYLSLLLIVTACKQSKIVEEVSDNFQTLDLPKYDQSALLQDFDLLTSSLKQAHAGLYWYSTKEEFDSIVAVQRGKVTDKLNGLQFYNIVAPIVAFTKEDHCDISISEELRSFQNTHGLLLPLYIKNEADKTLVINNLNYENKDYKGLEIVAINGVEIADIKRKIYNTFAADGFVESSKIVYLDGYSFAIEYARVIQQTALNEIKLLNPQNNNVEIINVKSVNIKGLAEIAQQTINQNQFYKPTKLPAAFKMLSNKTALITFNSFSDGDYKDHKMNFKKFVTATFSEIKKQNIVNLIIDVRENGGGTEGNEDYLFSYLTKTPYKKYNEVVLSNFTFDFLNYSDYASAEDQKELYTDLKKEHHKLSNGKIVRKPNLYVPEPLKEYPFLGKVYILTSGWTYSGGAEFCSLMKEHTSATFIGKEVGGGFYGNTSGLSLELTLPNTKLSIDIPLLTFKLNVSKGTFGRGVLPDYQITPTFEQFTKGKDMELEKAIELIN